MEGALQKAEECFGCCRYVECEQQLQEGIGAMGGRGSRYSVVCSAGGSVAGGAGVPAVPSEEQPAGLSDEGMRRPRAVR